MEQVPDGTSPTAAEQGHERTHEPVAAEHSMPEVESTGVESVDRVLVDVAAVADARVGDHVEVFERAHDQLRRALDAQPEPSSDGDQSS